MTAGIEVPVCLHLDHCPEREVISSCLEAGWNSVLFDASALPVEENQRQTRRSSPRRAATARTSRARSRASRASRTASAPTTESDRQSLEVALGFVQSTGVDVFAPAIGNAHGMYATAPTLDAQRVSDIVEGRPASRSRCTAAAG